MKEGDLEIESWNTADQVGKGFQRKIWLECTGLPQEQWSMGANL